MKSMGINVNVSGYRNKWTGEWSFIGELIGPMNTTHYNLDSAG